MVLSQRKPYFSKDTEGSNIFKGITYNFTGVCSPDPYPLLWIRTCGITLSQKLAHCDFGGCFSKGSNELGSTVICTVTENTTWYVHQIFITHIACDSPVDMN